MGLSIRKTTKKKNSAKLSKWNFLGILLFLVIMLLLIMQYVCTGFARYEIKYFNKV